MEIDTPSIVEIPTKRSLELSSFDEERLMDVLSSSTSIPITPGGWKVSDGLRHLISADSRFKTVVCKYGIPSFLMEERIPASFDPFHTLLQSIVHQQLATKAAESIHARVLAAYRNDESSTALVTPEHILRAKVEVKIVDGKRKVFINDIVSGLSESKARYVESLAEHFMDENKLKNKNFFEMSTEELYDRLVAVKGLGPWSVDMFLIFHMYSPNVLPLGDLIIRRGLCSFLGISEEYSKTEKKMKNIIDSHYRSWTPYCTLASLYLWHMSDEKKSSSKKSAKKSKMN